MECKKCYEKVKTCKLTTNCIVLLLTLPPQVGRRKVMVSVTYEFSLSVTWVALLRRSACDEICTVMLLATNENMLMVLGKK